MKKWWAVLRKSALWVALLPWAIHYGGIAMNQACLVRNGGRFPTMWTSARFWEYQQRWQLKAVDPKTSDDDRIEAQMRLEELEHGFLDDTHVWMNRDWKNPHHTWLNWLGDWMIFGDYSLSPGDIFIYAGSGLELPMFFIWVGVIAERMRKE